MARAARVAGYLWRLPRIEPMEPLIRLLPDHVANQIAAGEVVQRPASVVKELLENSVDAGAGQITLVLKDAGRTLVQVTDDGRGMGPDDARLCFERHATSKIRAADDLQTLRTKGFRGEALASIAAVAQVELRTRPQASELGTRVAMEGSRVRAQEPVAMAAGTTIAVRNLFYNIPARRQFLKSDAVELKHVLEEFQRVALAHPGIGFQVVHNDQELFRMPGSAPDATEGAALRQRVVHLLGRRYDERLVPVEESTGHLRITGYIGKPEFARRTRGEQYFFVNQRFIRSSYLEHAVRAAFDELVARDHHPAWFLFLELDPAQIDINIHPTKTEIKFRDDRSVYAVLHAALRRALGRFNIAPSLDFEPEPAIMSAFAGMPSVPAVAPVVKAPDWRPQDLGPPRDPTGWQQLFDLRAGPAGVVASTDAVLARPPAQVLPMGETEADHGPRPVFQMQGGYIVSPLRSGLMVVDRKRALERIAYERALDRLEQGNGPSQAELFPRNIELAPQDFALVSGLLPELRALGLDLEVFGGRTVTVRGLPAETMNDDPAALLDTLIAQLHSERGTLKLERHAAIARCMARSVAARSDDAPAQEHLRDLVDRLFACEVPYWTPGGKPTLITFGLDELAQRFERG